MMIFSRICLIILIKILFKPHENELLALQLNIREQVTKNTQNILKLDQAQYKFINQLTKLQDDLNDLEEEINKCKSMINRIQNIFDKNLPFNNENKVTKRFYRRFGSLINSFSNSNEIDDVFFISQKDGFIWRLENVSSFWNKTPVQLTSNSFYTDGQYGYKIRLKLDNPFGKIRVMLEILKGAFDSLLPWPFNNEIEISLLSQEYPYNHYTETTLYQPDTCLHRSLRSFKQYSHIYSVQLRSLLVKSSKTERDPLVIECLFNNGHDINNEKIFNRKIIWKIEKFYQKIKLKEWKILKYSFYTGDYGYKLQLVLYPNGVSDSGELNIFLTVLKGRFDDFLWWPFKYNVTVKVLNGNNTKNMCPPADVKTKNTKRSNSELVGFIFFNKSEIINNFSSVIKDNQMFIKFKTKSRLSYILNTEENGKYSENKEIVWWVKNYDKLKIQSGSILSEIFSTSTLGYNIRFSLYLNGERSMIGKYATVYFYIVNGSYDHILPWPFQKNISLSIIDDKNQIIDDKISVITNTEFSGALRPSSNHDVLVGYSRFMRLTNEWISKYVINDSLRIKFKISS